MRSSRQPDQRLDLLRRMSNPAALASASTAAPDPSHSGQADDPAAGSGPKVSVGYCMGARFGLHAASTLSDQFAAAAGIHPGALVTDEPDSPHHELASVSGELYYAFAENDQSATPEVVERFREELAAQGVKGVVERLPGTSHGFAMADLPVHDPAATERHFERTLELWRRNLTAEAVEA